MKPIKPLNKFWNRNTFFYKVRYQLLFREVTPKKLSQLYYNQYNKPDSIPQIYKEINKKIFQSTPKELDDFEKALTIATWLRENIKGGKGLGINSEDALKYMLHGGYGVCSDFCQIFNNFCVINHIKVREWGLKSEISVKEGHSFNEFYSPELGKWILIDVSNAIYFVSENKTPLSAIEAFDLNNNKLQKKTHYYSSKFKPTQKMVNKYYYSDHITPFLVDKYKNRFYDSLLKNFNFLPIPIVHGLAILLNNSYNYKKVKISN
jgi:hypothetical protein